MKCERCGKEFEKHLHAGRPRKYCLACACNIDKYKKMMRMKRKRGLGSSMLWEHAYDDFNREYEAVKREKRRIGLK